MYMIDGEVYDEYIVLYDGAIEHIPVPTREGYTFSGWSEIPETMPAYDVTVTGSFILIGDVNGDYRVDVADIVALINIITTGLYSAAADLNNDGKVNDADISILVQMIMGR